MGRESTEDEEWWRKILLGTHSSLRWGRTLFKHLPADPRCKLCAAPFRGAGAPLMRLMRKEPWPKNPKYCGTCFKIIERRRGGIEIECSFLFADVRGSTALAEQARPAEFRELMDRFYNTAAHVLVEYDAIVDKFVGDEVIGIFIPGLTGGHHADRAIASAQALLAATGHDEKEAWVPIGAGVHTGTAFVGTVGEGSHIELTALGDPVNVTARLAASAGPGEILVTLAAAEAANLQTQGLERRELALKGKSEATSVLVVTALRAQA